MRTSPSSRRPEETAKEVVETLTYRGHLADGSLEQHSSFYTTGEDLDDFRNIGGLSSAVPSTI